MNKRIIAFIVLLVLSLPTAGHAIDLTLRDAPAKVLFSPDGGATQAIVREIDNARLEILVQAYSFTSAPIARALVMLTDGAFQWRSSLTRASERRGIAALLFWRTAESLSTSMRLTP